VLAATAALTAPAAGAQQIHGRVADETNGGIVAKAGVHLLDAQRKVVVAALSDESGRHALAVPRACGCRLRGRPRSAAMDFERRFRVRPKR
jgi:hypothetical protein